MGAPVGPACYRASQAFTSCLDTPASAFAYDGRDMDQRFNRCVSVGDLEVAYYFIDLIMQNVLFLPLRVKWLKRKPGQLAISPNRFCSSILPWQEASRISFPLHLNRARLAFDTATAPDSWERPGDEVSSHYC